jgi:hypothetical protein
MTNFISSKVFLLVLILKPVSNCFPQKRLRSYRRSSGNNENPFDRLKHRFINIPLDMKANCMARKQKEGRAGALPSFCVRAMGSRRRELGRGYVL